jgi:hypothetical protein
MDDFPDEQVSARYVSWPSPFEGEETWWVDMPEANPRARFRTKNDQPQPCVVTKDCQVHYDPELVEYDDYPNDPEMHHPPGYVCPGV